MKNFTEANAFAIYWSYTHMAVRSLLKNKLVSAFNIIGLSLGMAVALILFLWVRDEVSFNIMAGTL